MPRWEVCEIKSPVEVGKRRYVRQAMLYGPSGSTLIAQSGEYTANTPSYQEGIPQLEALIAQLAKDGWEPLPTPLGELYATWLFKRQL